MKNKDQVYSRPLDKIKGFEFNESVASVFDDMISRSVPFYDEIHRLLLDVLDRTYPGDGKIYDLGCSTGTTMALIDRHLKSSGKDSSPQFVGIDSSAPMLKRAEEKLRENQISSFELRCEDINQTDLSESQLTIMNYTLQFIPMEKRSELLEKIYDSLLPGGVFLLSEKLKSPNEHIDNFITDLYYDFKRRNGYSELEISQKREALENVLVPLTPKQHMEMLNQAGFTKVEMIFRWYNFACYLGIK